MKYKYYLIKVPEIMVPTKPSLEAWMKIDPKDKNTAVLTKEELEIIQVLGYDVGFTEKQEKLYYKTCNKIGKVLK